jgi:hypothetical protein
VAEGVPSSFQFSNPGKVKREQNEMTRNKAAPVQTFDPFHNRLCRDIRNDLSVSFMTAIRSRDLKAAAGVVKKYMSKDVEPFVADYMENRLNRYRRVVHEIGSQNIPMEDTYGIACRIWNQSLFFEFHEWLEQSWHRAAGTEKQVLQALIRSAGVYLLLESGRMNGAKKMAAKAAAGLSELQALVPGSFDVARLIDKLSALDPVPPEFECR